MRGKYKLVVVILIVVVIVVVAAIFLKRDRTTSSQKINQKVDESRSDLFVNVNNDNETLQVNLANSQAVKKTSLAQDILTFSGLPEVGNKSLEISLVSGGRSKAIVSFSLSDNQSNSQDYICDLAARNCQLSDLLTRGYQGIDKGTLKDGADLWWSAWDSEKNLLYAHLTTPNGDFGPIWKCDIQSKICSQNKDLNAQSMEQLVVPQGAFSPSLKKIIAIDQHDQPNMQTGTQWDLLLYDALNLEQPLKKINITQMINKEDDVAYDSLRAVAWTSDEQKIFVTTFNHIYSLDLVTGLSDNIYTAPSDEDGEVLWDSSNLKLVGDSYLTFIQQKEGDVDEQSEENPSIGILKKLDLEDENRVTDIMEAKDLTFEAYN